MKKTFRVLISMTPIILFLLISEVSLSQSQLLYNARDFMDWQKITKSSKGPQSNEDKVQGSAYLNRDFELGSVLTEKNIKYIDIPLRYNMYNDDIEFELETGEVYAISNPKLIKEIKIGDYTFIYTAKDNDRSDGLGFYNLVIDGKTKLLTAYTVDFTEATKTTGYKAAEPPRFDKNPPAFYLKIENNKPVRISNKKDVKSIFGDDSKAILAYVKENRISFKKEEDLKQLVQHLNMSN